MPVDAALVRTLPMPPLAIRHRCRHTPKKKHRTRRDLGRVRVWHGYATSEAARVLTDMATMYTDEGMAEEALHSFTCCLNVISRLQV